MGNPYGDDEDLNEDMSDDERQKANDLDKEMIDQGVDITEFPDNEVPVGAFIDESSYNT